MTSRRDSCLIGMAVAFGTVASATAPERATSAKAVSAKPAVAEPADRAALNLRDFDFLVAEIGANCAGWRPRLRPKPALNWIS